MMILAGLLNEDLAGLIKKKRAEITSDFQRLSLSPGGCG
jgi:hypothetical protein